MDAGSWGLSRVLIVAGWSVGCVALVLILVYLSANYGGPSKDIQRTYMVFDPILWAAFGTLAIALMAAVLGHVAQLVRCRSRADDAQLVIPSDITR